MSTGFAAENKDGRARARQGGRGRRQVAAIGGRIEGGVVVIAVAMRQRSWALGGCDAVRESRADWARRRRRELEVAAMNWASSWADWRARWRSLGLHGLGRMVIHGGRWRVMPWWRITAQVRWCCEPCEPCGLITGEMMINWLWGLCDAEMIVTWEKKKLRDREEKGLWICDFVIAGMVWGGEWLSYVWWSDGQRSCRQWVAKRKKRGRRGLASLGKKREGREWL